MKKHELESKVAHLEAQLVEAKAGLSRIAQYCESTKFWSDGNVNTQDIVTRVREELSGLSDLEVEPWGLCTDIDLAREIRANGHRHIIGITGDGFITFMPRYLEGYNVRRWAS